MSVQMSHRHPETHPRRSGPHLAINSFWVLSNYQETEEKILKRNTINAIFHCGTNVAALKQDYSKQA